jgi:hypothetical protein
VSDITVHITLQWRRVWPQTINVAPMENYSALAKIFFDFHSVGNMLLRACLRPSHSAIVNLKSKRNSDPSTILARTQSGNTKHAVRRESRCSVICDHVCVSHVIRITYRKLPLLYLGQDHMQAMVCFRLRRLE